MSHPARTFAAARELRTIAGSVPQTLENGSTMTAPPNPPAPTTPSNPQFKDRVTKMEKWATLGVDPYGQRTDGLAPIADARKLHKGVDVTPHDGAEPAKVAGR